MMEKKKDNKAKKEEKPMFTAYKPKKPLKKEPKKKEIID